MCLVHRVPLLSASSGRSAIVTTKKLRRSLAAVGAPSLHGLPGLPRCPLLCQDPSGIPQDTESHVSLGCLGWDSVSETVVFLDLGSCEGGWTGALSAGLGWGSSELVLRMSLGCGFWKDCRGEEPFSSHVSALCL